ncbi:MAG: DUF3047 domain-containing protein [Deltaproteobacteria bacterium]|nr:MAG: DUF3047 domain-containing protein [Deltaproteobacteria bacterium]
MSLSGLLQRLLLYSMFFSAVSAWASGSVVIADFSTGVDESGVPLGWELKERSGKADLSVIKDSDIHAVHLRSAVTSFSIEKQVNVDICEYPLLTWKWKVTKLPKGADFRTSWKDDQAAQLFLAFPERKIIVYIWDTLAPQGLMQDAPSLPFMSIKAIVVRSGPSDTGKWITETRNACEDYKELFDEEPPPVGGTRIQINSQHTGTSAESYFADVVFRKE